MSPTTRDHVLQLPLYLSVLRVIQIVLAVILLGLAAYTLSVLVYPGLSLTLFTVFHPHSPTLLSQVTMLNRYQSLATLITTIYILITAEFYPITYNYWPALGLDIFLVVFWLVSFALTASEAKHYYQVSPYEDGCFRKLLRRQECFHTTSSSTYRDVLKAIAVFGAFEL